MLYNLFVSVVLGIVQGITEWLPVSSTGHMILLNEFLKMNVSEDFFNLFLVVIQFGSILAVVVLYFNRIWPLKKNTGKSTDGKTLGNYIIDPDTISLWLKIIVASLPAIIIGLPLEDFFEAHFYNGISVAIMLILFGIAFIVVETKNEDRTPVCTSVGGITYQAALFIGFAQLIAALFPGTSRSGATIIAALIIGIDRISAAEFTFFLAIPAMFGASLLKLIKYRDLLFSSDIILLLVGMVVAFVVSIFAIRFLMNYIKTNNFKVFGWYRIGLGTLMMMYFLIFG